MAGLCIGRVARKIADKLIKFYDKESSLKGKRGYEQQMELRSNRRTFVKQSLPPRSEDTSKARANQMVFNCARSIVRATR